MWTGNSQYKFVTRSGIERLISFDARGNFVEDNFCFIPGFQLKEIKSENYYTGFQQCLKVDQVEERLFRKYRVYKSNILMMNFHNKIDMYPHLFNIDYYVDDCKGRIMMDMSFTFLNWNIIEQLRDGEMELSDIDESYIK